MFPKTTLPPPNPNREPVEIPELTPEEKAELRAQISARYRESERQTRVMVEIPSLEEENARLRAEIAELKHAQGNE